MFDIIVWIFPTWTYSHEVELYTLYNLKVHENRRQLLSASASKDSTNPFVRQRPLASTSRSSVSPRPWANGSTSSSQVFNPWSIKKSFLTALWQWIFLKHSSRKRSKEELFAMAMYNPKLNSFLPPEFSFIAQSKCHQW